MRAARWSLRVLVLAGLGARVWSGLPPSQRVALADVFGGPVERAFVVRGVDVGYETEGPTRRTVWIITDGTHDIVVRGADQIDRLRLGGSYRLRCRGREAEAMVVLVDIVE